MVAGYLRAPSGRMVEVAAGGGGTSLLALQAEDEQWAGGSYFSALAEEPVEYSAGDADDPDDAGVALVSKVSMGLCVIAWGTGNSPSRRRRSGSSRVPLLAADAAVGAACSAAASLATVVHFHLLPHPFSAGEMVSAARH